MVSHIQEENTGQMHLIKVYLQHVKKPYNLVVRQKNLINEGQTLEHTL